MTSQKLPQNKKIHCANFSWRSEVKVKNIYSPNVLNCFQPIYQAEVTNLFRPNKPCSKKRVCACAWENHSGLNFLCAGEREVRRSDETKQFPGGFSSIKLRWVLNCIYQVLFRLNRVQLSVISTKKRKTWAFNYRLRQVTLRWRYSLNELPGSPNYPGLYVRTQYILRILHCIFLD